MIKVQILHFPFKIENTAIIPSATVNLNNNTKYNYFWLVVSSLSMIISFLLIVSFLNFI